jgi:hypothetical protein
VGSYCDLYIGNYSLYSWKNYPDVDLIKTIFRQSDLIDVKGRRSGAVVKNANYSFEITVGELSQRMDILGYTIKRAKQAFEKAKKKIISEEMWHLKQYDKEIDDDGRLDYMISHYSSTIHFLEHLSFEKLQEGYKNIITKRVALYKREGLIKEVKSLEDYFKSNDYEILDFGYLNSLGALRIILSTQTSRKKVIYNLTEILLNGYISRNFIDWNTIDKIIVLTEGSTDAFFLKESLNLLYPHLSDAYYFMDFHEMKNPGGAGQLVNIIKAFAGSGIRNKIVAIFDNDTGAREALLQLKDVHLPENIVVMKYPKLKFATKYPTHGPTGLTYLDINGLACSIELYLGRDVISNKRKYPMQWKGFSVKTKTYQGEVLNKEEIQKLFIQKLKTAKQGITNADWSGIDLILQQIFLAFQ